MGPQARRYAAAPSDWAEPPENLPETLRAFVQDEVLAAGEAARHGNAEAAAYYRRLVGRLEAGGYPAGARVRALYGLGGACDMAGDWGVAMEEYGKGLALAEGMPAGALGAGLVVEGRLFAGDVHRRSGRMAEALAMAEAARDLADRRGLTRAKARATGNMGNVYNQQGDLARAMECHRERLRLSEEMGDRRGKAIATGNMGVVYWRQGDLPRAMECHEAALALWEEMGARREMTGVLIGLARAAREAGARGEGQGRRC